MLLIGGLLGDNPGVGKHAAPLEGAVSHQQVHLVGGQLVFHLVPERGRTEQARDGVDFGKDDGVADGLDVAAEHFHIVPGLHVPDRRGVAKRKCRGRSITNDGGGIRCSGRRRELDVDQGVDGTELAAESRIGGDQGVDDADRYQGIEPGEFRQRIGFGLLLLFHPFGRELAHFAHLLDPFFFVKFGLGFTFLGQGVEENVLHTLFGFLDFAFGDITARNGIYIERVGTAVERVDHVVFVLAEEDDGRISGHQAAFGEGILRRDVLQMVAQIDALVRSVEHLGIVVEIGAGILLPVIHFAGPGLIHGIEHEHVVGELDQLLGPVVPARIGPQEAVVLPGESIPAEIGLFLLREIPQGLRLELDRVEIDFDPVFKSEEALLAVIGAVGAFDHIAVAVFHRAAALKHGHTVFRIVDQAFRAEDVAVLVEEFHEGAFEDGAVFIDPVGHLVAAEHRLVLDDLDVAVRLDEAGVHVPGGGIAKQIGVVVQEAGVAFDQAVVKPVFLILLRPLGLDKPENAVW